MSEPIKEGDMVQVVRTCCSPSFAEGGGYIYRVSAMQTDDHKCASCGQTYRGAYANSVGTFGPTHCDRAPLPWLKRIPPLNELESAQQKEDIREPA